MPSGIAWRGSCRSRPAAAAGAMAAACQALAQPQGWGPPHLPLASPSPTCCQAPLEQIHSHHPLTTGMWPTALGCSICTVLVARQTHLLVVFFACSVNISNSCPWQHHGATFRMKACTWTLAGGRKPVRSLCLGPTVQAARLLTCASRAGHNLFRRSAAQTAHSLSIDGLQAV